MTGPRLAFDERFAAPTLDLGLWVPHYLPHWTTPERSRARYRLDAEGLELRIEEAQPPWREEDGAMRVSSLQTATFSGPVGSPRGTHRHRSDGLLVRTAVPSRRWWTPTEARLPIDARVPHSYAARWGSDGVRIAVDGVEVFASDQVVPYPVQLMVSLFELDRAEPGAYPKTVRVHRVLGSAQAP